MRNIDIFITLPELQSVTESLYQDDSELGNIITFGMRLTYEELPKYQTKQMIRGQREHEEEEEEEKAGHTQLMKQYEEFAYK